MAERDPTPKSPPLPGGERRLLKERAYEELRHLITTGELAPGTFLSERQLAARLGMSKTPVRSAIERLANEGFVSVSPQQGIVVRELSLRSVVDHFDLRIALETFVMRRLAGQLSAEQVSYLQRNLAEQAQCATEQLVARAVELDADFHLSLCEFLGNQEITWVMWRQRGKLNQVVETILRKDARRILSSYKEHAAIVQALIAGEGQRAAELLEAHLNVGKTYLTV
jgi:DNA-binding GntR family transcriptional regulator